VWGEMIQYKNQNGWMLAISCIDGLLHRCSIRASPRRRIILPYRPVIQSELPLAGLPGPEGAYFRSRRRALTTFLFVDHGHRDYESFLGSPLVVGRLCNRRESAIGQGSLLFAFTFPPSRGSAQSTPRVEFGGLSKRKHPVGNLARDPQAA
jgi:hypothetical protein